MTLAIWLIIIYIPFFYWLLSEGSDALNEANEEWERKNRPYFYTKAKLTSLETKLKDE